MSNDTEAAPLIATHRDSGYRLASGEGGAWTHDEQRTNEEDRCRNTSKILAFSTFLIALSVGGYFCADLLANKGESIKIIAPSDNVEHNDHFYLMGDLRPDNNGIFGQREISELRPDNKGIFNPKEIFEQNGPPQNAPNKKPPKPPKGKGEDQQNDDSLSTMKVTNCERSTDYSYDGESYQSDIRAVANYLKTYWISYSSSISNAVQTLSDGDSMDPQCIQQQFEDGEVVCKEAQCIYDGKCLWKEEWNAITLCKYYYFDIGGLRHQTRADRRACIASMLVEEWTESCSEHSNIATEMASATFKWWKETFTVSDDWELTDCPCQ